MPSDRVDPPTGRSGLGPALWPALREALIVLVAFTVAGAACGLLWYLAWEPPTGIATEGRWVTDGAGLRRDFSGTGLYVVIATVGGLAVGALTSYFFDRSELVTLLAVAGGAALAGWLMWAVGVGLGPPDPESLSRSATDGTRLPGALRVSTGAPFAAFPVGALGGLALVFLTTTRRHTRGTPDPLISAAGDPPRG